MLRSVSKTRQRNTYPRQPIADLQYYLFLAFVHRFNRAVQPWSGKRDLSFSPTRPLRYQSCNSLPGAELSMEQQFQRWKSTAQFAAFQQEGGIPRPAGELQLRASVRLEDECSTWEQSAFYLRVQRTLQIVDAEDQRE